MLFFLITSYIVIVCQRHSLGSPNQVCHSARKTAVSIVACLFIPLLKTFCSLQAAACGVKKPHCFRPGTVPLREIRCYRKSTELLIVVYSIIFLLRYPHELDIAMVHG